MIFITVRSSHDHESDSDVSDLPQDMDDRGIDDIYATSTRLGIIYLFAL